MNYKNKNQDVQELISKEYYELITKERLDIKYNILPKIRQKVQIARELGDLSENAEYQTELSKKTRFEQRLGHLDFVLGNSIVFKIDKEKQGDKAYIGAHIHLLDMQSKEAIKFQLVSSFEVDPSHNKISYKSAIAKLIIGQKVNYTFQYRERKFKIKEIKYD